MFFHLRAATTVAGLAFLVAAPVAAQDVATVYLKEGGSIRGQIVDDSDPNGIKVRSEKSGTTFMLRRAWVDSIIRPGQASAAPTPPVTAAAPARPSTPPPAAKTLALEPRPVEPRPVEPKPAEPTQIDAKPVEPKPVAVQAAPVRTTEPAPPVALPPAPAVQPAPAPVRPSQVDGLEPPPKASGKQAKAQKEKAASSPVRYPSKWYLGGGGSAYTGTAGEGTDIGYSGMLGYGSGLNSAMAVRLGASGSYWRLGSGAGDFYDVAGNIDLIVGPRAPRFVSPYAVLGGMGGVRSISPVQVGATGYTRDPLYGARLGAGFSAKRIFLEASYQHVWVDGVSSGYVPFVFGFRF